jgi:hypothetical protein
MKTFTSLTIFLADDEWGNETMQRIAEETFLAWSDPSELVLTVYEHAGWSMTFRCYPNGRVDVVSSANDMAVCSPEQRNFWEEYNHAYREKRVRYLNAIRRDQKAKVAA